MFKIRERNSESAALSILSCCKPNHCLTNARKTTSSNNNIWVLRQLIERQFIERQFIERLYIKTTVHRTTIYRTYSSSNRKFIEPSVDRTDSLSNRQFIEPTVYRTDSLSKRQFIEPTDSLRNKKFFMLRLGCFLDIFWPLNPNLASCFSCCQYFSRYLQYYISFSLNI